jgi:uridine kinase
LQATKEDKTMRIAPAEYETLGGKLSAALGPNREPLLIGIDGKDGVGKTSLATWVAWQFGMPTVHLDLFIEQQDAPGPLVWRVADLDRCVEVRGRRPFVIEGVLLLDALDQIGRSPDFLIFVDDPDRKRGRPVYDDLVDKREFSLANQIARYSGRRCPADRADFRLNGF